ncbi:UDP-N-acetylmuramoyl-L-alanine--D-glutamate ligase [Candidatus Poribacteria bacterium]|nr:UDP-N-acetylmuramoyl-L-alanine--D-glutamate ligase [Candidatus Poribacteria bacterium]
MKRSNLNRFSGKRITIFGANRSGIAIAKLLYDLGASISLTDTRDADVLSAEISQLDGMQIQFYLGGHEESCIANTELVVVSPGVPLDIPILVEAKNRSIPILGELEVSASLCDARIVAITGTKGKSTTTLLTAAILEASNLFSDVVVAGNIGVPLASNVATLTRKDVAVVEASSFQLESTFTFQPVVSVMLNFSRDHLDRHGTMESYLNAKLKICVNQTNSEWIVLNADDATAKCFAHATAAKKAFFTDNLSNKDENSEVLSRKLDNGAGARLQNNANNIGIYTYKNNQEHWICNTTDIPLAGAHNIRNVLAAVVVGTIFDVTPADMCKAILKFNRIHPAFEHAFEKVSVVNGVDYVNDSKATNVIATCAALESVEKTAEHGKDPKRVFLIIGGFDKGNDYGPLIELVRTKVKSLVMLGEHTHNIQKTFAGCADMHHTATMEAAVEFAYTHAKSGDIVLLSPSNASFDMYTDYKQRGEAFKNAVNSLKSYKSSDQEKSTCDR